MYFLQGPPASAQNSILTIIDYTKRFFVDGRNITKSGMIDYIFHNKPKFLLIDEIDKIVGKDQTFLLNLMETRNSNRNKIPKNKNNKKCEDMGICY